MILFPAIDLYDKKAVRLYQGDYRQMTVYGDDPAAIALDFEKKGATHVHVVDLEGAKDGAPPNLSAVEEIVKKTSLSVQTGGGIRSMERVERYLALGVERVILGTAAVADEAFLHQAVKRYGNRIAVGADVKDGFIAVKGWTEKSSVTLCDFLSNMQALGVEHVVCTDISKDGAMRGTNLKLYKELSEKYTLKLTASGGVSSLEDIRALNEMRVYGAIIGKAYYTGAIDLREALEAAK